MRSFWIILLFAIPTLTWAQETSIASGSYTGCGGFIVDSGLSASDYGNNENYTMTVCPEAPDTIVNLYFNLFALGEGDVMYVYDGPDTGSPLIGEYMLFDAQGLDFYASETNESGCITLNFVSDGSGVGNFVAEVTCGYPCERPFAIVETEEDIPIKVCPGEEITFDSSPSTVADGFNLIEWDWDFGDGNTNDTDGAITSHSYEIPGAYKVQLSLTDDNECTNNNLTDVLILVSTEPDWTGMSEDVEICLGQELDLTGAVQGVLWDGTPSANLGGELWIPDDQTECFESEIVFTSFLPGQEVESEDDIDSFFINFEHSFMGDLTITFLCPNGQSMSVHQQGGGGTWLGEPVDDDGQPLAEGVGYDYWWAPDAVNGTWADEGGGGTLPSDTYSSAQPWSLLEGCPLNGTWTIEICDSWGSDNGFIFDWTVNFDPDLFPEPIVFTPQFGPECDSTFWAGEFITSTSADCDEITIQPGELGSFDYLYSATNNHGCTYIDTVTVDVVQGPIAVTPEELYYCGTPLSVGASIANPEPGTIYNYQWDNGEFLSNDTSQNPNINDLDEETTFTVTVFPQGSPECSSSSDVTVYVPSEPTIWPQDTTVLCAGQEWSLASPGQEVGWTYTNEWYFAPENDPLNFEFLEEGTSIDVDEAGTYQLVVTMVEPCDYQITGYKVIEIESCELIIPNVFTPNGDGFNDYLEFSGLDFYPGSSVIVYNRWGGIVFQDDNYKNNWSPTLEEASEGTYYYILTVAKAGDPEIFQGHFTLLRDK